MKIIRQKQSFLKQHEGSIRIVSPIKNGKDKINSGYRLCTNCVTKKMRTNNQAEAHIIFVNKVVDIFNMEETYKIILPLRPRLIKPPR